MVKKCRRCFGQSNTKCNKIGFRLFEFYRSGLGKLDEGISGVNAILPKKVQKSHQIQAIESAKKYFENGNTRGKLIMACGTGKTYTSLKIAEMFAKEKMLKTLDFLHTHKHTRYQQL